MAANAKRGKSKASLAGIHGIYNELPAGVVLLGKANQVFDLKRLALIGKDRAVVPAEHLMHQAGNSPSSCRSPVSKSIV